MDARTGRDVNARPVAPEPPTLRRAVQGALLANPAYTLLLMGRGPDRLVCVPPDPWPGDAARGRAILARPVGFPGEDRQPGETRLLLGHDFAWLRDLRAVGDAPAVERARQLLRRWLARFGGYDAAAWSAPVAAARLTHWLALYPFLDVGADDSLQTLLLKSLGRHARHLGHVAGGGPADARRLLAVKGLIYAGACLPGGSRRLARGLRLLAREIDRQVLPDGGHIERSPAQHLAVLGDLVDIRATLAEARCEVPAVLQNAIDRLAPMLRVYRHGDGGLAVFNESGESDSGFIDQLLAAAGANGRAPARAPHLGMQRLAAGDVVVIADAGVPPPPGVDALAHAGTLAFEMSDGADRLVVNCGADPQHASALDDWRWRASARATAAHSTLVVDDTNSSQVLRRGGLGARVGTVTCRREEQDGTIIVDMSHDGYAARFHLIHRRRLFLAAAGDDLRGEDVLTGTGGARFAIRFHLHPAVKANRLRSGAAVTLALPSGRRWRFHAAGGALEVEESVYFGAGSVQETRQIVVSGRLDGEGALVKWAIRKL